MSCLGILNCDVLWLRSCYATAASGLVSTEPNTPYVTQSMVMLDLPLLVVPLGLV